MSEVTVTSVCIEHSNGKVYTLKGDEAHRWAEFLDRVVNSVFTDGNIDVEDFKWHVSKKVK